MIVEVDYKFFRKILYFFGFCKSFDEKRVKVMRESLNEQLYLAFIIFLMNNFYLTERVRDRERDEYFILRLLIF